MTAIGQNTTKINRSKLIQNGYVHLCFLNTKIGGINTPSNVSHNFSVSTIL